MLLIHKKQMWRGFVCKESRLCCVDFLDAAGNAIEGFAAAGTGAGELLRALGGIANHLGKGTGWMIEQGPYAIFAAYLAIDGKGQDVWGDIFEKDFPDSLTEYHNAGLILPDPFDAHYVDSTKTPPEFKRAEYNRDWKAGWHKRYGLLERLIVHIRAGELAHANAELVDLKRSMEELDGKNTDALVDDRPILERRLKEIDELLRRRISTEKRRALIREQRGIFANLSNQNDSMRLIRDLNKKISQLEREVSTSEGKIASYEEQKERILKCVDPEDKIALEKDYRKARFEEIMIKAGMEGFLTP